MSRSSPSLRPSEFTCNKLLWMNHRGWSTVTDVARSHEAQTISKEKYQWNTQKIESHIFGEFYRLVKIKSVSFLSSHEKDAKEREQKIWSRVFRLTHIHIPTGSSWPRLLAVEIILFLTSIRRNWRHFI